MRAARALIGFGVLAAALATDVEPADAFCSVFTRHPCFPAVCSVFASRYCIPYPIYWIGQDLRLTIESVFSNLKEQMRLDRHLAKTPRGLAQRIAQRILALTLGILLNTLNGRPARALAAYDGR